MPRDVHRLCTFVDVRQIAVVYLVVAAVACIAYLFSSFWVYHFVNLEHGESQLGEVEVEDAENATESELLWSRRNPERVAGTNCEFQIS